MGSAGVRIAAALGALAGIAIVASCGNSSPARHARISTTTAPTPTATAEAQPGMHNADDVTFARNMLADQEQGIELSTMVPTNTTNQQLIALAQKISAEQQPEIQAFTAWLLQWDQDPNADPGAHGAMPGLVDQATMDKFQTVNGPEFDKLWLQSMVLHQQGAIEMAQVETARGQNPDVIAMAKSIMTTARAETDQMKRMPGG